MLVLIERDRIFVYIKELAYLQNGLHKVLQSGGLCLIDPFLQNICLIIHVPSELFLQLLVKFTRLFCSFGYELFNHLWPTIPTVTKAVLGVTFSKCSYRRE